MSIFKLIGGPIGVPEDQVRMLTGFLACIPIGFAFQNINGSLFSLTQKVDKWGSMWEPSLAYYWPTWSTRRW